MNADTWSDAEFVGWLKARAEVLRLDADKDPQEIAELGITGFPTFVLERDGSALDRTSGFRPPDAMRSWFELASAGVTGIQQKRNQIAAAPPREALLVRTDLLIDLVIANQPVEAAVECIELWRGIASTAAETDSYLQRFRNQELPKHMRRSAAQHEEARRLMTELAPWPLDRPPSVDADPAAIRDWLTLDWCVNEGRGTAHWARLLLADDVSTETLALARNQPRAYETLVELEMWQAAGVVQPEPVGWWLQRLERREALRTKADPTDRDRHDLRTMNRRGPDDVGQRIATLLAADREPEARQLLGAADEAELPGVREHTAQWLERVGVELNR